ncbi:hypothetical protein PUV54_00020 [Hyphococcus flavus]|uniref:Uncharacterized protein n=1 Tax=Hyphococcus flavus TaxID=1866326 RepID=A0AAE9ZBI1_9PROT|nr:hypothetical protein [Hyphococcus flavus]WDI31579.1 hypothetical protein PUV54_00020 [Hyphococcus flavus]
MMMTWENARKWISTAMIGVILILSIARTTDRFTGTEAREAIAVRDQERKAAIRIVCRHHADDCAAEDLSGQ